MATTANQYAEYPVVPSRRTFSWSGIFAGTFVFLAIEATFGVLGAAIFASASNPSAAVPTTSGMTTGLQIWMVILSIIALYCAGRTSSKLLYRTADRNLGMYHGLVTFGMSIFSTIVILALAIGGSATSSAAGVIRPVTLMAYISSGGEYWLFAALVLAMIAAAIGGIHGTGTASATGASIERTTTRNAA